MSVRIMEISVDCVGEKILFETVFWVAGSLSQPGCDGCIFGEPVEGLPSAGVNLIIGDREFLVSNVAGDGNHHTGVTVSRLHVHEDEEV